MDFVRSHFGKMKLWPIAPFFIFGWVQQRTQPKVIKKMKKRGNWSEFHFFRSDLLQNPYFSRDPEHTFISPDWNLKEWLQFYLILQAVINSTITPNMTFTKTSQKFGQWSDVRANTVYGLGFSSEVELNKVIRYITDHIS